MTKSSRLNFAIAVLFFFYGFNFSGLGHVFSQEDNGNETITLGAIIPLSGALASIGMGSKRGLDIGVEHINKSGGISGRKLKIAYEDSVAEPTKAISAFNLLVSRSNTIPAIFTTLSSISQALKEPSNKQEVFIMADATLPNLLDGSEYMIRRSYVASSFYQGMIEHFLKNGISRVALIVAEEEWGKSYLEFFKDETRISLVGYEEIAKDTSDAKSSLLRLRAKTKGKADALVIILAGSVQLTVLHQVRQSGIDLPLHTIILCSQEGVSQQVDRSLNGITSYEGNIDRTKASYKILEQEYRKISTLPLPELSAVVYYDFLFMLKEALEEIGLNDITAQKLKEYVISKKQFTGVAGPYQFDERGDSIIPTAPYEFKNNSCSLIE